ncbi:putative phage repressor [Coriobacterium glomerans PW2]|uniref:Phage repressor n=2 Tax=Coriobacterium TaxID=33870 RepID=F2N8J6_CORGP|nr:putative phage repressor [Coriobacterium glomerans PW2]
MEMIAEQVRLWLSKDGNSMDALAGKLNLSSADLQKKLSGKSEWYWSQVLTISEVLGCRLEDLR